MAPLWEGLYTFPGAPRQRGSLPWGLGRRREDVQRMLREGGAGPSGKRELMTFRGQKLRDAKSQGLHSQV